MQRHRAALVAWLERLAATRPAAVWLIVLAITALVSAGDVLTGAEVQFTPLYFVPIAIGGWFVGSGLANVVAAVGAGTWLVTVFFEQVPRRFALDAWNLLVQVLVFGTIAYLVPRLRAALSSERAGRVDAERDLEHAQRLTTVGRMAAGIAHELGTPLNVAGSYSRMIREGRITGAEAQASAGLVEAQIHFMTGIIRQLLDFARGHEPRRSSVSLPDLVAGAVGLLTPMVNERHVELVFVPPTSRLPRVDVDGAQLHQVFSNLIMNAVQASPPSGRVEVTLGETTLAAPADLETPDRQWLVVRVRDEGAGISPAALGRIFEPFFTTKPVGEGTGLGLAVAWGITRRHGGWIGVESTVGKGTSFSVYLPRGV